MGTGIHVYVEKKVNGVWEAQGTFGNKAEDDEEECYGLTSPPIYRYRNYYLFAILAGVGNYFYFHDPLNVIAPPRGIPKNASPEYLRCASGSDWHSHSWLTLRNILNFDWTQKLVQRGWFLASTYIPWAAYEDSPCPKGYWSNSPQENILSDNDVKTLVSEYKALGGQPAQQRDLLATYFNTYVPHEWGAPYHTLAGPLFLKAVLELLVLGGGTKGINNIRMVFFFDN